jgi:putative PIN family toxin of toxin-antitoxin system
VRRQAAKIRAAFDCVVFLQAAVSQAGPAFRALQLVESGDVELLLSAEVLSEVGEVLSRKTVREKFAELTEPRIAEFLSRLRSLGTLVTDVPAVIRLPRDPGDEPYLNLALAGQADYLVTRDRDLLDFEEHPATFRIVSPETLLAEAALKRDISS